MLLRAHSSCQSTILGSTLLAFVVDAGVLVLGATAERDHRRGPDAARDWVHLWSGSPLTRWSA